MDISWKTCKQKRRYSTKAKAAKKARKLGKNLRPYQCPACGKWHLTHWADKDCVHFEKYGEK